MLFTAANTDMGPMMSSSMAGGTEKRTMRRLVLPVFSMFFETDRFAKVLSHFWIDVAV